MFTGIVEALGTIENITKELNNINFTIYCPFVSELKIDQSIAHNGVCLTVTSISEHSYTVTAIDETLSRTTLGLLKKGDQINLERCLPANGRIDGHFVQGHVDLTAVCSRIKDAAGSWVFDFNYDESSGHLTVSKGSVCVNGVSLTVVDAAPGFFSVAIIPYTFENTVFKSIRENDRVNIEFDILGKYLAAWFKQTAGI